MRTEAAWRRRDVATSIVAASAAVVALYAVLGDPYSDSSHLARIGPGTKVVVVVAIGCCGVAFGAVVRLVSGRTASVGEWVRRTCAGMLLLNPALVFATFAFNAPYVTHGCGSLIAPNDAKRELHGALCDARAQDRLFWTVACAGIAFAVAVAYGLWLHSRRGGRKPRRPVCRVSKPAGPG